MFNRRAFDIINQCRYFSGGIVTGYFITDDNSTLSRTAVITATATLLKAYIMNNKKETGVYLAGFALGMIAAGLAPLQKVMTSSRVVRV